MTDIFVFGSNLAGRHGRGAALDAVRKHGALYGVGVGIQGRAYAIPTKDHRLSTLPLREVRGYINAFVSFACRHPELTFYVTPVGCGLAGYSREEIRPMFEHMPNNCRFAETW